MVVGAQGPSSRMSRSRRGGLLSWPLRGRVGCALESYRREKQESGEKGKVASYGQNAQAKSKDARTS